MLTQSEPTHLPAQRKRRRVVVAQPRRKIDRRLAMSLLHQIHEDYQPLFRRHCQRVRCLLVLRRLWTAPSPVLIAWWRWWCTKRVIYKWTGLCFSDKDNYMSRCKRSPLLKVRPQNIQRDICRSPWIISSPDIFNDPAVWSTVEKIAPFTLEFS